MSDNENLDPYEPYVDPEEGENLDPINQLAQGSYVYPEYAKGYGYGKTGVTGIGRGLTTAGRGINDLLLSGVESLYGKDSYEYRLAKQRRAELAKKTAEENKYWEEGLANEQSGVSGMAKTGDFIGRVLPDFAVPASKALTLGGRALSNAARYGASNAAMTQGNVVDRGAAGATGAVGGGLGSAGSDVIAKGIAGARGKWGDDAIKQMNDRLVKMGLKPRVGDLAGREDASVVRGMENWSSHLPLLKGDRATQEEALRRLVVPDKMKGTNKVTEAVRNTDKKISEHADAIYAPVKQKIGKTSILINPSNMHAQAAQLRANYPKIFDDSYYKRSDIDVFNEFIDNPGAVTYDEFRKIQQILGSAQGRADDLVKKGEIVGQAVGDAKQAYKASKTDFNSWGQSSSPKTQKKYAEIVKEHNDATKRWEDEVLPWKQSDVADDLRKVNEFGAPDSARILTRADTDKADLVRHYLKQFGPKGNSDIADALAIMRRDSHALGNSIDDDVVHSGSLLSGILAPGLVTGATGSAKMSANNIGKAMYFGDSLPVMTSMPMRGLLGASAEVGEDELGTLMVIKQLMDKFNDSGEGRSIGSLNESGAAAGQQGERK